MAKKEKAEEKKEDKKIVKNKKSQEKYPVFQLCMESKEDTGVIAGALNERGMYLQFIDDLKNNNQNLMLSKEEFDKIIEEFKKGEL